MANNCYNYIEISGDKSQIEKLKKDFPESITNGCDLYTDLREKYKKDVGNDARWFDIDVNLMEDEITLSGDSAWCPCLELFTAISEKFPELNIKYSYEEQGCDFSGWADISDGNCNDNEFTYWKGLLEREGEAFVLNYILENELECMESEEDLTSHEMYLLLSEESKKIVLESYNGRTS
jgi:hypothetical protein